MNEWTSVKDAIPTNDKWVFAIVIDHGVCIACVVGEYDNRPNWSIVPKYSAQFKSTNAVTHWMAIPDPPPTDRNSTNCPNWDAERCSRCEDCDGEIPDNEVLYCDSCAQWRRIILPERSRDGYCIELKMIRDEAFGCVSWKEKEEPKKPYFEIRKETDGLWLHFVSAMTLATFFPLKDIESDPKRFEMWLNKLVLDKRTWGEL